jgi:hypothetical protein
MKINVRIAALAAALSLYGSATAATAGAQDANKPGGLNKVAHDISKTSKKAGRDIKAETKRAGSKAHNELTDAGNATKKTLKKATGIKAPQSHQPGGLNKVARDISKTSKKAGRDTKAETKRAASKTHNTLTDAGNETKTVLKKTTGIKGSQSKNPGGLNKVARNISRTSKKAASDAKAEKNRVKSDLHGASTEAGKSVKDTVLKGKP